MRFWSAPRESNQQDIAGIVLCQLIRNISICASEGLIACRWFCASDDTPLMTYALRSWYPMTIGIDVNFPVDSGYVQKQIVYGG